MKRGLQFGLLGFALIFKALPAQAHPGHLAGAGFFAGFMHPLSGWDHFLAMTTLGLWLGLTQERSAFLSAVAAWMIALSAGFILGLSGFHLPLVEPGILATVLILGLLAATATRLSPRVVAPMLAAFAVFHGHAHGTEAPEGAATLYALGFVTTSVGVIAASYGIARRIPSTRREVIVRAVGGAVVAASAILGFAS
jgi:urease accessory protein